MPTFTTAKDCLRVMAVPSRCFLLLNLPQEKTAGSTPTVHRDSNLGAYFPSAQLCCSSTRPCQHKRGRPANNGPGSWVLWSGWGPLGGWCLLVMPVGVRPSSLLRQALHIAWLSPGLWGGLQRDAGAGAGHQPECVPPASSPDTLPTHPTCVGSWPSPQLPTGLPNSSVAGSPSPCG